MTEMTEEEVRRIVRQEILVHVLHEHRLDFEFAWPALPEDDDE